MKPINKKLALLLVIALTIAVVYVNWVYKDAEKKSQPEATKKVVVFDVNLDENKIVEEEHLKISDYPISKIPTGALNTTEDLIGKRLAYQIHKGQVVFEDSVVTRGVGEVEASEVWEVGIDVKNISNILGAQLVLGEEYMLAYRQEGLEAKFIDKVVITNLVDATGKVIVNESAAMTKTVNVGVEKEVVVLEIVTLKGTGEFELVRAPETYEFIIPEIPLEVTEEVISGDELVNPI